MSKDINVVALSGNLTRDGELKTTQSGTSVLTLGVASSASRKNPHTDEWEDVPGFYDCVLFGRRAEALAPYVSKGTKVFVKGQLRWSQWQERETGKNRSKVEIAVDEIVLGGSKTPSQAQPQQAPQPYTPQQQTGAYGQPMPAQPYQQPPMYQQPVPAPAYAPVQPTVTAPVQQPVQTVRIDSTMQLADEEIPF